MSGSNFHTNQERLWSQILIKNDIWVLTMYFTSRNINNQTYTKLNSHTIKSNEYNWIKMAILILSG